MDSFAIDLANNQARPVEQARAEAALRVADLLPAGVHSEGTLLYTARVDGVPVGWIWIRLPHAGRREAWIYDLRVDDQYQGNGYGRAIMLAAEQELAVRGVTRVGLNVFGDNQTAIRLYESLGFAVTAQQMSKSL